MADKQDLPHFDSEWKADSKKVIAWLNGEETKESKEKLSESYQDKKRADILSDTQENDKNNATNMEGRYDTTMKLRREWIINDSDIWVDIKWLCSLASTESHNKVLKENFWDKVQEPYNQRDSSGKESALDTVKRSDANKTMEKNKGKLKWEYDVATPNYIKNTIFPWIKAKYENVKTDNECLSVLQQINPDLFTRFLLKDDNSHWLSRQEVEFFRDVLNCYFDDVYDAREKWGLFLVWNA